MEPITNANEASTPTAETKVVKLRLPMRFIIHLQFLKLTRRQDVSVIVAEALGDFFQSHPLPDAATQRPMALEA